MGDRGLSPCHRAQRKSIFCLLAELRFAEQRPQQDNPPPGDRQSRQAGQQDGLHRMDFGEADGAKEHDKEDHHHHQQDDLLPAGVGRGEKNLFQVHLHTDNFFFHISSALLSPVRPPGSVRPSG